MASGEREEDGVREEGVLVWRCRRGSLFVDTRAREERGGVADGRGDDDAAEDENNSGCAATGTVVEERELGGKGGEGWRGRGIEGETERRGKKMEEEGGEEVQNERRKNGIRFKPHPTSV